LLAIENWKQNIVLTCSAVSSSFHFSSGVFLSSFSPDVAMARMESRRDGVGNRGEERLNAAIDDGDERVDARCWRTRAAARLEKAEVEKHVRWRCCRNGDAWSALQKCDAAADERRRGEGIVGMLWEKEKLYLDWKTRLSLFVHLYKKKQEKKEDSREPRVDLTSEMRSMALQK